MKYIQNILYVFAEIELLTYSSRGAVSHYCIEDKNSSRSEMVQMEATAVCAKKAVTWSIRLPWAGSLCQRMISTSLLHKSENVHTISFPLDGCMDTFQDHLTHSVFVFYNLALWCVFKHHQPHRCIFGVFPLKAQPLVRTKAFIWGPSKWMFSVLCGRICLLAGRLWDEVCPLRQCWMMMDWTHIWPEPGRDQQGCGICVCLLQFLVAGGATNAKRVLLIIDEWLDSGWVVVFFFFVVVFFGGWYEKMAVGNISHCVRVVKWPRCCSQAGECERYLSDAVHTNPHILCTENLSQARARISGAPLFITTAPSITASLQNHCDKLPQKPALFLTTQSCCIFEDWQLFRGLQDKGKPSEWEHFVFHHSRKSWQGSQVIFSDSCRDSGWGHLCLREGFIKCLATFLNQQWKLFHRFLTVSDGY